MAAQASQAPRPFNNAYLPNGAPSGVPSSAHGAGPQPRVLQSGSSRILCVADVRGNLKSLNELAKQARADYIIHTGDFGFYDERSLDRIAEKTFRHVAQYSPLISEDVRRQIVYSAPTTFFKDRIPRNALSQLPEFLSKAATFNVPVYTVWGACEDVQVLEKLRSGEYKVDNLHIIDEAHSKLLEIGGLKLRLLGLGGAVVMHKLFDNGEGKTTIAGGQGTMWTTLLQMGELVDTANRNYDPSETRILITHASPAREGLLNQLSVALKVDFSISAGLHFRYGSSYNEFSVNPSLDHYRGKLAASKASFQDVWETVKSEVEPAVAENETQQKLLNNALDLVNKMPAVANGGNPFGGHVGPNTGQVDEMAFKNMWNFNLADAAFGWLVLEVDGGRIGTEMRAQGFNFAHRGMKNPVLHADMIKTSTPSPSYPAIPNLPVPPQHPAQAQSSPQPRTTGTPSGAGQQHPGFQGQRQNQPQQQRSQPAQQAPTTRPAESGPSPVPQSSHAKAPLAARPAQSPASQANSQPTKSATPQATGASATVSALTTNGIQKEITTTEGKTNGSAPSAPGSEMRKEATEPKFTDGIFVQNVNSEEEVKNLFSEEDRAKIQRVEKRGVNGWIAHFSSLEEATAVLEAVSPELKGRGERNAPKMKPALDNPHKVYQDRTAWNNSSRGDRQQSGYGRGGPSDADGARGGRGGSLRGRGRGTERGRGSRGGRGGFSKGDATSAASAPAPAPVEGGSA